MDEVTLPKGTTVKLRGFPCELTQDTPVISSAVAEIGLENLDEFLSGEQIASLPAGSLREGQFVSRPASD